MSGDRLKINDKLGLHFVTFTSEKGYIIGWSSRPRYRYAQMRIRGCIKKIILFIACVLIFNIQILSQTEKINFKKDTTMFDFQKYVGSKVYCLMLDDNIRCFKRNFFSHDPPGKAQCLNIRLNDQTYITIYVVDFKVMKQFDENLKWDITKFYEETIKMIEIYDTKDILIKQFK